MKLKFCKACNGQKIESDFYNRDNTCKECRKSRVRENRLKRLDYYRSYDRDRGNRQSREYIKEWRETQPNKYRAVTMIGNCVRDKKLFPEPCEVCGSTKTVAHHDDYLKPLNVRWLCQGHHKQWHAKHGPGKNGGNETLEDAGLGETPTATKRQWGVAK